MAVGINDVRGTRRYHSLYLVGTKTISVTPGKFEAQVSLGYGSTALDAMGYVLDGLFGGMELQVHRFLTIQLENDTEKWNTGIRIAFLRYLSAHVTLLHMDTLSGGIAWTQHF